MLLRMKALISVPGNLFRAAARWAHRAQKFCSQLYGKALSGCLARHVADETTAAMNKVVAELAEPADPFVAAAARRTLERTEW